MVFDYSHDACNLVLNREEEEDVVNAASDDGDDTDENYDFLLF